MIKHLQPRDINDQNHLVPEVEIKGNDAWQILCTLPLDNVDDYVKTVEFGFRFKSENLPNKGKMRYYDCSRIKVKCKPQCARRLLVFIPNSKEDAIIATISIKGQHTCSHAPANHISRSRLAAEDQRFIETMLKAGHPSRDVKACVKARNPSVSNNQLGYAIKTTKVNLFGNGELSLGEFVSYIYCY